MARGTRDENAADKTARVRDESVANPATGDTQAPDFPSSVGGWVEASKERELELAEPVDDENLEPDAPQTTVLPNGDEVKAPGEYKEGEKVGYELGGGWRGNVTVLTEKGAEVVGPDRTVLREAQPDDPKSA